MTAESIVAMLYFKIRHISFMIYHFQCLQLKKTTDGPNSVQQKLQQNLYEITSKNDYSNEKKFNINTLRKANGRVKQENRIRVVYTQRYREGIILIMQIYFVKSAF